MARAVKYARLKNGDTMRYVRNIGGGFQPTGKVVSEFKTTNGNPLVVVEFGDPESGTLHIYRPDQIEDVAPEKPARRRVHIYKSDCTFGKSGTVLAEVTSRIGQPYVIVELDTLIDVVQIYRADQIEDE